MARREFDLRALLDIPLWEAVQDQLALLTGTAIITIDYKGNPITKHSGRTAFCSVIRENPTFRKRCYRCDALAGLEAVRLGRPYVYLCHCGIVDAAVPIIVEDQYLGAVMFGQVRIPRSDTDAKVERLVNEISSFQAEMGNSCSELVDMYGRLPEMEYARIMRIADMIGAVVNYIVDRAINNRTDSQGHFWPAHVSTEPTEPKVAASQTPPVQTSSVSGDIAKSSSVYPAIAYVRSHPGETVSMNQMATLCHLSPSYFSRLFHREVGEGFTSYVNRHKIELAKQLLRETAKSISQISLELGYLNTSHFINLFKRFEGITPLNFRQNKY